jgi:hypothetical protein
MAAMRRRYQLWRGSLDNFRLFFVQAKMAATTEIVRGAKLDEQATVASYNFPGVNRG